jgi:hypothetical protein
MPKTRSRKFFLIAQDNRPQFSSRKQLSVISLLNSGSEIYLNEYGKLYTSASELGSFQILTNADDTATLTFNPFPGEDSTFFDYHFLSYDTRHDVSDIGVFGLPNLCQTESYRSDFQTGITTVARIPTYYRSAKILSEISFNSGNYDFSEINMVHDGNQVYLSEYGKLYFDQGYENIGLGTYNARISDSFVNIEYIPNVTGIAATSNSVWVGLALTEFNARSSRTDLRNARLETSFTSIDSKLFPIETTVATYPSDFNGAYYIILIKDVTNNKIQLSEVLVLSSLGNACVTEYGVVTDADEPLGYFTGQVSSLTELFFTPNPKIEVELIIYQHLLTLPEIPTTPYFIDLNNSQIISGSSRREFPITGQNELDFNLRYNGVPVFQRIFNAENVGVADTTNNIIVFPQHFFVTGEKVQYKSNFFFPENTELSIGIAATVISGVGLTDKLSGDLYVYKIDDRRIKLSTSAENALANSPKFIDFTSQGIGQTHYMTATNQNSKCILMIDNVIQSPIVATAITSSLISNLNVEVNTLVVSGITSFFSGDLIRIENEVMRIDNVRVEDQNYIDVKRPWVGTAVTTHFAGDIITKVKGNFNIIENTVHFASPPYGPVRTPDYNGDNGIIPEYEIKSTFQGRVFIRSGVTDTTEESYEKNYIFDDVSKSFDGNRNSFEITNSNNSVTGFSTNNAVILINSIMQGPESDYNLDERSGKTNLVFTGTATSALYDPNTSGVPRGGIIVSIASSNGFGLQPLVCAGGTAIISPSGQIQSVSIANSGSGYRSGLQIVNVSAQTDSVQTPSIEFIGTAIVSNGNIIGVDILNSGSSYSQANPPEIVFDDPLSYANLDLQYVYPSSGVGTQAKIDIVVGQGSSVINFEMTNFGYSYKEEELLTLEYGGTTGIPTDSSKPFDPFLIRINRVYEDQFSAWSIGSLQQLDDVSYLIDGQRRSFPLLDNGNRFSIIAKPNSFIDIKAVILVFVNDVLQQPTVAYEFNGGSVIRFTEAPELGSKIKIIFYRGTEGVDVKDVNIQETIKKGDKVRIAGTDYYLNEDERLVTDILAPKIIETNPYRGVGLTDNEELLRPLVWTKQRQDLVINGENVTKDRELYEPKIYPVTNVIQNIGIADTVFYVENIKTIFDNKQERSGENQAPIEIVYENNESTGIATAIVNSDGTIELVDLTYGGYGYTKIPSISIAGGSWIRRTSTYAATISDQIIADTTNGTFTIYLPDNPNKGDFIIISDGGDWVTTPLTVSGNGFTIEELTQDKILNTSGLQYEFVYWIDDVKNPTVTTWKVYSYPQPQEVKQIKSEAFANISNGVITSIQLSEVGFGYTNSNPPIVLIESPNPITKEIVKEVEYLGDFGIISGITTTTLPLAPNALVFDLVVPPDSFLQNFNYVDDYIRISKLEPGYYFSVFNSNIGYGLTSYRSDGSIIGIGTQCIDNIYQVISVSVGSTEAYGILGLSPVLKVAVSVDNFNGLNGLEHGNFYGEYSWGLISPKVRNNPKEFFINSDYGVVGLNTTPIVRRKNYLSFFNY